MTVLSQWCSSEPDLGNFFCVFLLLFRVQYALLLPLELLHELLLEGPLRRDAWIFDLLGLATELLGLLGLFPVMLLDFPYDLVLVPQRLPLGLGLSALLRHSGVEYGPELCSDYDTRSNRHCDLDGVKAPETLGIPQNGFYDKQGPVADTLKKHDPGLGGMQNAS